MPIVLQGALRVNLALEGITLLSDLRRLAEFMQSIDPDGFIDVEEVGRDQSGDTHEQGYVLRLHNESTTLALLSAHTSLDRANPLGEDLWRLAEIASEAIDLTDTQNKAVHEIVTRVDMFHRLDEGDSGEYLAKRFWGFLRLGDLDMRGPEGKAVLTFVRDDASWVFNIEKRRLDASNLRLFTRLKRTSMPQGIPSGGELLQVLEDTWKCSWEIASRLKEG